MSGSHLSRLITPVSTYQGRNGVVKRTPVTEEPKVIHERWKLTAITAVGKPAASEIDNPLPVQPVSPGKRNAGFVKLRGEGPKFAPNKVTVSPPSVPATGGVHGPPPPQPPPQLQDLKFCARSVSWLQRLDE